MEEILTETKAYSNVSGCLVQIKYSLFSRRAIKLNSTVYDICCERLLPCKGLEILKGITDNYIIAEKIFRIISQNIVTPEHLADVIDDLLEDMTN